MPTYEYECKKCGRVFEEFHSITRKALKTIKTDCAECHNRAPVTRRIGMGAGVIFKGSGFYETDYRSEQYKKEAKADQDSAKPASETKDKKAGSSTEGKKTTPATDAGSTNGKKPESKQGKGKRKK